MNTNTQEASHALKASENGSTPQKLKEFVERFQVCWGGLAGLLPGQERITPDWLPA